MLIQTLAVIGILLVTFLIVRYESFVSLPQVRRRMSYDIRGDVPIPYVPVSPWNNPEVGPIHNRPIM